MGRARARSHTPNSADCTAADHSAAGQPASSLPHTDHHCPSDATPVIATNRPAATITASQHLKKGYRLCFDDGDTAWLTRKHIRPMLKRAPAPVIVQTGLARTQPHVGAASTPPVSTPPITWLDGTLFATPCAVDRSVARPTALCHAVSRQRTRSFGRVARISPSHPAVRPRCPSCPFDWGTTSTRTTRRRPSRRS